ncbi:MAG: hypothetical protein MZV64_21660 [Ignavibacteriales bacterium]|nr:hypothetical protein [Ignavibacteriales bacterium]
MAVYELECDVIVQNGNPLPVLPPPAAEDSGDQEGLQYKVDGVRTGGFEGWCDGELVRLYKAIRGGEIKAEGSCHRADRPRKVGGAEESCRCLCVNLSNT